MERRALLAVLLSVVAVVVWYGMFPPNPAPKEGAQTSQLPPGGGNGKGEREPLEKGLEGPREVIRGEQEEEIVLAGDGFRAVVTSRGAMIRSWTLATYRDKAGKPQELVSAGLGVLALEPAGPWNQELWQVSRQGDGVVLRWADGSGRWWEKRLEPEGRYGLRVTVRGLGVGASVGVVVSGGLATWSEGGKSGGLSRADFVAMQAGKLQRVAAGKAEVRELVGPVSFVGVEDEYFLLALVPSGEVRGRLQGKDGLALVEGQQGVSGLLLGVPKEHALLKSLGHGLDQTLSFGLFGFISLIFLSVLRWIYSWSGNWGVGIILLTAAIRLLLFPLTHKSTVAMRRMAKLQPKIKAIQERYQERAKKDPAARKRMNQEMMELYRREGVNPMGGCLPLLVQIPILWGLYTLFAFAIELRHQPFVFWIRDLSAKDPTYITPILMTASMVLQQKLAPQTGDPAQRRMFMVMPFVFGLMFMNFPAGLVLYWLVNNVLTIAQQVVTERLLQSASKES